MFNINNYLDEFGNLKNEFEVIQYEKYANDEWVERRRFNNSVILAS